MTQRTFSKSWMKMWENIEENCVKASEVFMVLHDVNVCGLKGELWRLFRSRKCDSSWKTKIDGNWRIIFNKYSHNIYYSWKGMEGKNDVAIKPKLKPINSPLSTVVHSVDLLFLLFPLSSSHFFYFSRLVFHWKVKLVFHVLAGNFRLSSRSTVFEQCQRVN